MEICYIWYPLMVHSYGVFHRLVMPPSMYLKVLIVFSYSITSLFYHSDLISSCSVIEPGPTDVAGTANRNTNTSRSVPNVVEDEVDEQLWKLDGKIQRKRDEKL